MEMDYQKYACGWNGIWYFTDQRNDERQETKYQSNVRIEIMFVWWKLIFVKQWEITHNECSGISSKWNFSGNENVIWALKSYIQKWVNK